jgi:hypothetical protein
VRRPRRAEVLQDAAALAGGILVGSDAVDVDPGRRQERAEAIDREDHQREGDLLAEICHPEDVEDVFEHDAFCAFRSAGGIGPGFPLCRGHSGLPGSSACRSYRRPTGL